MADWVDGKKGAEPPPELAFMLMTKAWGPEGQGWGEWPAWWMARLRIVRNVYNVWRSYTRADNRSEWTRKADPGSLEMVGIVKRLRYETPAEEGVMERWRRWVKGEDGRVKADG